MKDLRKQVKRKSKKETKIIQEKVNPSPESSVSKNSKEIKENKENKDFNSLEEIKEKRSKIDISKIDHKYTLESNLDHKEYISKESKIDISKFDHYNDLSRFSFDKLNFWHFFIDCPIIYNNKPKEKFNFNKIDKIIFNSEFNDFIDIRDEGIYLQYGTLNTLLYLEYNFQEYFNFLKIKHYSLINKKIKRKEIQSIFNSENIWITIQNKNNYKRNCIYCPYYQNNKCIK